MSRVITLVLALGVTVAPQVCGQTAGPGPIERSSARAAAIFAATSAAGPSPESREAVVQPGDEHGWDGVQRLRPGARLIVTTRDAQRNSGRLVAATDSTLRVTVREGRDWTVRRDDVQEVSLDRSHRTGEFVGLGLLAGGGAGLAMGAANECDCELRGLSTAWGGIWGAVMGLFGGWVVGGAVGNRPERLVYRHPAS